MGEDGPSVNPLAVALRRPLLRRALLVAVVAVHVGFVIAPLDVLAPVVAHDLGQHILHGRLPGRDFPFEYPTLAAPLFLLPGLVPAGLAKSVLALQAVALELVVVWFVVRPRGAEALWRWALASILIFPFLAGGFDAAPMAALAMATALLARGKASGWWVAAVGAMTKLTPITVWSWARRPLWPAIPALALTVAVLVVPSVLAEDPDDAWIGFSAHRGVQVESTPGVSAWVVGQLGGDQPRYVYNQFKSWQVEGADGWATAWMVFAGIGVLVLLVRCGRYGPTDPWLASLAAAGLFLVGNKVFSPQFVAWATPLAVVLGGRWWRMWLAVLAATTFAYVIGGNGNAFFITIAVRNALVVGVVVAALARLRPAAAPDA